MRRVLLALVASAAALALTFAPSAPAGTGKPVPLFEMNESAFAKPDVSAAFARGATYSTSGALATFVAGGKTVTFDPTCKTCAAPGTDVEAFEKLMRGVLMNRRLLCP